MITVRDRRLSILTMDSAERKERTLRLVNIEEQDQGLYRCIQGDATLNEILLDVLGKCHPLSFDDGLVLGNANTYAVQVVFVR